MAWEGKIGIVNAVVNREKKCTKRGALLMQSLKIENSFFPSTAIENLGRFLFYI